MRAATLRAAPSAHERIPSLNKLTVVGTGYVGLVSGASLADFGNNVICVDSDAVKVERLKALELPFFEPGLPEMVRRNVHEGRLHFTTDLPGAVRDSKVVFITVRSEERRVGKEGRSRWSPYH